MTGNNIKSVFIVILALMCLSFVRRMVEADTRVHQVFNVKSCHLLHKGDNKMYYHKACRDCVANHDCLFQKADDVESCQVVENWEDQIDLPDDKPDGFKQIGE